MFELVHFSMNSALTANVYGLANITLGYFDMILAYLVAIVVSIIIALILRVPLMPSDRYSFDVSAIYPTPIIAIGILSLFLVLNYTFAFNGLLLAAIIGVCFVREIFILLYISHSNPGGGYK